ncbi:MAG: Nif3-like dinuclear metal center hexameric protein [Peptostreptococcaceae bacterium]|nr:Nif3-like dinuclear metal center hexameric protein [Peptostreptococcaceae bacterium]
MKLKSLIKKIEAKYPTNLAYDWDNVGLLVGDAEEEIDKVLVCLEANEAIVEEAINNNVNLIVTHHPFIFGKMKKITTSDFKGKLIHKLIKNNIAVYSMHTNFDIAFDGLNDYFMEVMGFENSKILDVTNTETLYKIVVYVPKTHEDKVREALGKSGAGHIGNYSDCTFNTDGKGTFRPLEGTNPFIGELDKLEVVDEVKIETIVPQRILGGVISAMIKAHPYEEVAYDLYKLENKGSAVGLGRIAALKESMSLKELSMMIKEKLNMDALRVVGSLDTNIKKVAVVTGSGADLAKKAQRSGADVLITGDVKYHDAQDAIDAGMCIIDCNHFESEDIFKDVMKRFLDDIDDISVIKSRININPFSIL